MKIRLTESQYRRIFLSEQGWGGMSPRGGYGESSSDWSTDSQKEDIFKKTITDSKSGNSFRSWIHSNKSYLDHVNKHLMKKWGDSFDKSGTYNNMYIKEVFKNLYVKYNGMNYPMGVFWSLYGDQGEPVVTVTDEVFYTNSDQSYTNDTKSDYYNTKVNGKRITVNTKPYFYLRDKHPNHGKYICSTKYGFGSGCDSCWCNNKPPKKVIDLVKKYEEDDDYLDIEGNKESTYFSEKKKTYELGKEGLISMGIPKEYIPTFDKVSGNETKNIQIATFNLAGFEMVKQVEWYKENYYGGDGCRWVDVVGMGQTYKGQNMVLNDLNPWGGDLSDKIKNRKYLPTGIKSIFSNKDYDIYSIEELEESEKMKTNNPWMTYWLLSPFRSSGGQNFGNIPSNPERLIGTGNNWVAWFLNVYGTTDIGKVKSMIDDGYQDRDEIGIELSKWFTACVGYTPTTGFAKWISEQDYHFWLDVASIVVLAVPVAGVFLSSGIDLMNATAYYIEGDELGAGLTSLGALPLVGKFVKAVKPNTYTKVQKYFKELSALSKEGELTKDPYKLKELTKEAQNLYVKNGLDKMTKQETDALKEFVKGVSKEEESFKNLAKNIDDVKLLTKDVLEKNYTKINQSFFGNKLEFNDFKELMKNKNYQRYIQNANGDIRKAIYNFNKSKAGKDFLIQAELFTILYIWLPDVTEWINNQGQRMKDLGVDIETQQMVNEKLWEWRDNLIEQTKALDAIKKEEADKMAAKEAEKGMNKIVPPNKSKEEQKQIIEQEDYAKELDALSVDINNLLDAELEITVKTDENFNMKKENLNEEINRIKQLFTEERLYGNLVESSDSDKKFLEDLKEYLEEKYPELKSKGGEFHEYAGYSYFKYVNADDIIVKTLLFYKNWVIFQIETKRTGTIAWDYIGDDTPEKIQAVVFHGKYVFEFNKLVDRVIDWSIKRVIDPDGNDIRNNIKSHVLEKNNSIDYLINKIFLK